MTTATNTAIPTAKRGKGAEPKPNGARKGAGGNRMEAKPIIDGLLARVCLGTTASSERCPNGDCITSSYEMDGKIRATITMNGTPKAIARSAKESCAVGIVSVTRVTKTKTAPEQLTIIVLLADDGNTPFDYELDMVFEMQVGEGYRNRFAIPGTNGKFHLVLLRSKRGMALDRIESNKRAAGGREKKKLAA